FPAMCDEAAMAERGSGGCRRRAERAIAVAAHGVSASRQLLCYGSTQLFTDVGKAACVIRASVFRDPGQDRFRAQLTAGLGTGDERVGLDFPRPEALQVGLDVVLAVIGVPRVGEIAATAGFEVIDPGECVCFDKVVIKPEPVDDQVARG